MEMEETKDVGSEDSSFIWDDTANLYFHAGSGFYHDPVAGWYYSSRDGLYYTFENGCYVLLQSNQADQCEAESGGVAVANTSDPKLEPLNVDGGNVEGRLCSGLVANESNSFQHEIGEPLTTTGDTGHGSVQEPEFPPPPSNWLEETLINLYLSGYNRAVDAPENSMLSLDMDAGDSVYSSVGEDINMTEEQERMTKVSGGLGNPCESIISEDISREEENWLAQYGQVVHEEEETLQHCAAIDLWDWTMVTDSKEDGKGDLAARLVGRLVKPSAKLHPSVHSSGRRFRTALICEVHLDLVRVKTGQIYKLHNPSSRYLASLSTYDSSNPTKDWCFPQLSVSAEDGLLKSKGSNELRSDSGAAASKSSSYQPTKSKKQRSHPYKDRAAERRKLHGGYGVGPGQKISSPEEITADEDVEVEAEAPSTPFGADSYARKILEGMGWQEGEGLGSSRKGLIEPIQAVGNTGNAGIGWPKNNNWKHR